MRSSSSHFFVQYLFPDFAVPQRVVGFAFLSNDGATVFPSAGVLLLPIDGMGFVDVPTAEQLANLQVTNIDTPGDTSVVFVDLQAENIILDAGSDMSLVVALQFPQGGQLVAEGVGPGIAADADEPDQLCDIFTIDGGVSGIWFEPFFDPQDPQSVPLDWGFEVILEPVVSVEDLTWAQLKTLYRNP
ncbi:MAG: hypothetical protein ACE5G2_03495 [Candidatus Krumholzibacteriia bacterium]